MNIREVRTRKGFTQQRLAELTGLDQAAISRMENGKQRMTLKDLLAIAEALGVPIVELIDKPEAA
jgi:transcriptional regulator with XRE-family HTH domain